jgi:hypothetical protein
VVVAGELLLSLGYPLDQRRKLLLGKQRGIIPANSAVPGETPPLPAQRLGNVPK